MRLPTSVTRLLLRCAPLALIALLLLPVWYGWDDYWMIHKGYAIVAVLATIVIFGATQKSDSLMSRFLAMRPLVYTGKLSYGLYLYHWPILTRLQRHDLDHQRVDKVCDLHDCNFRGGSHFLRARGTPCITAQRSLLPIERYVSSDSPHGRGERRADAAGLRTHLHGLLDPAAPTLSGARGEFGEVTSGDLQVSYPRQALPFPTHACAARVAAVNAYRVALSGPVEQNCRPRYRLTRAFPAVRADRSLDRRIPQSTARAPAG